MRFSELKNKTWIDWLKVIVAIDIAAVGIGLILNINMHIFAHLIGFLTRIPFGVMYVFIAVLIFKRVFPDHQDEKVVLEKEGEIQSDLNHDIKKGFGSAKRFVIRIVEKIVSLADGVMEKIDHLLDRAESGITKRKTEVKEEVKKLMDKN